MNVSGMLRKFASMFGVQAEPPPVAATKPAETKPPVQPEKAVPDAHIGEGLAKTVPVEEKVVKAAVAPDQIADAQKAKDSKVTEIFVKPTKQTSTTVSFKMPEPGGKEIGPGERWLFQVPEEFRGTPIRTAILIHRKDTGKHPKVGDGKWDAEGAYNLVTARQTGTDKWVTWSDQYGSKKFAEPRSSGDPENENLHDWLASVGNKSVDLLAVTGAGNPSHKHAVASVHEVVIEFFPPGKVASHQEEIFTPGTSFVDLDKGKNKPTYGGGMGGHLGDATLKDKGMYPDSVEIGGWGSSGSKHKSDKSYVDARGNLHIKLEPGQVLGGFECSCGDTAFDKNKPASEQRNQDGHYGRLGWAKLYARVQNSNVSGPSARTPYFMERVNVPPSGVLSGGPAEAGYVTKPGDEIVVESQGHKTWVMGYRVTYTEPED